MDKNSKNTGTKKDYEKTEQGKLEMDPKLLEMLVCPVTHGPLEYNVKNQELVSRKAGLAFPIRDGIPIMLEEEARRLDQDSGQ